LVLELILSLLLLLLLLLLNTMALLASIVNLLIFISEKYFSTSLTTPSILWLPHVWHESNEDDFTIFTSLNINVRIAIAFGGCVVIVVAVVVVATLEENDDDNVAAAAAIGSDSDDKFVKLCLGGESPVRLEHDFSRIDGNN
jgi:hypothetical protein